jgi:hypothetical protein
MCTLKKKLFYSIWLAIIPAITIQVFIGCKERDEIDNAFSQLFRTIGHKHVFVDYDRDGEMSLITNNCVPPSVTFTRSQDNIATDAQGLVLETELTAWVDGMQDCVLKDNLTMEEARNLAEKVAWIEVPGSLASLDLAQATTALKLGRLFGWPKLPYNPTPGPAFNATADGQPPKSRAVIFVYLPQGPREDAIPEAEYDDYYDDVGGSPSINAVRYPMYEEVMDLLCGCYESAHTGFQTNLKELLERTSGDAYEISHQLPVMVHSKSYSGHRALKALVESHVDERAVHYSFGPSFGLFTLDPWGIYGDCSVAVDSGITTDVYDLFEEDTYGEGDNDVICNRHQDPSIWAAFAGLTTSYLEEYGYDVAYMNEYEANLANSNTPMCIFNSINDCSTLYDVGSSISFEEGTVDAFAADIGHCSSMSGFSFLDDYISQPDVGTTLTYSDTNCYRPSFDGWPTEAYDPPGSEECLITGNLDVHNAIMDNLTSKQTVQVIPVFSSTDPIASPTNADWEAAPDHTAYWESMQRGAEPGEGGEHIPLTLFPEIMTCAPLFPSNKCKACGDAFNRLNTDYDQLAGSFIWTSTLARPGSNPFVLPSVDQFEISPLQGRLTSNYSVLYLGPEGWASFITHPNYPLIAYPAIAAYGVTSTQFRMSPYEDKIKMAHEIMHVGDGWYNDENEQIRSYVYTTDNSQLLSSFTIFEQLDPFRHDPQYRTDRIKRIYDHDWLVEPLLDPAGKYYGKEGAWLKVRNRTRFDRLADDPSQARTHYQYNYTAYNTILVMKWGSGDYAQPQKPLPITRLFDYTGNPIIDATQTDLRPYATLLVPGNSSAMSGVAAEFLIAPASDPTSKRLLTRDVIPEPGYPQQYKSYGFDNKFRFQWNPQDEYCRLRGRFNPNRPIICGGIGRDDSDIKVIFTVRGFNNRNDFEQDYPATLSITGGGGR